MMLAVGLLAPALPAAGDPPQTTSKVTGTFAYQSFGGLREVVVTAHGSDPVRGSWEWLRDGIVWGSGPITCLVVDGDTAWLAGPTSDGSDAVFVRLEDGGTPGTNGDTAVVYGTEPEDTLEDMEEWCLEKSDSFDDFAVTSGNLNVWDVRE